MIDAGSSIITALFVVAMIVSVAVTCYVCGIKIQRSPGQAGIPAGSSFSDKRSP
ncbi:MAG: hypothetical protein IIC12_02420 [Proteobacteria bacterium]|nr:hypothetical protein [Pseudomonadota bacterium]